MQAQFFKNGKLKNSTYTTTGMGLSPMLTNNIVLKEPVSITRPVIQMQLTRLDPYSMEVNYVTIPELGGRSYFINSWTCARGNIWEAQCIVDVLASWRKWILDSEQFVVRAEKVFDSSVIDSMAPAVGRTSTARTSVDSPWKTPGSTYVLEVVGRRAQYYAFPGLTWVDSFFNLLFSNEYLEQLYPNYDPSLSSLKASANVMQYIGGLRFYPYSLERGSGVSSIPVGFGSVPALASLMPDFSQTQQITTTISVPKHPQSASIPYTNLAPFSTFELYYPPFGTMPLNPKVLKNVAELTCVMRIEHTTGRGALTVFAGAPMVIVAEATAQIGVDIAVGQILRRGYSSLNQVSDFASILANTAKANVGGAVSGVASTIMNMIQGNTPMLRAVGADGGMARFSGEIACMGTFQSVKRPPAHFAGYPLYEQRQLSSLLGGYVQCEDAEFSYIPEQTQGTFVPMREECDMIESFLEEGVYLD